MNEDTKHTGPPEIAAKRSHRAKPPVGTQPIVEPARTETGEAPAEPAKSTRAGIPPCPKEDPLAGDKTPAVIAWWFKYHSKEAAAKYEGRKYQLPADHE